jgi:hypothetical protein
MWLGAQWGGEGVGKMNSERAPTQQNRRTSLRRIQLISSYFTAFRIKSNTNLKNTIKSTPATNIKFTMSSIQ